MLTQYFVSLLTTGVILFSLALIVFLKGFDRRVNQTYAFYSVCVALWATFEALAITSHDHTFALWLWRISQAGTILIPVFFVHFVFALVGITGAKRKLIPISYFIAFVFLGLDASPLFISDVVPKFAFRYFISPGYAYYLFFAIWTGWAVYGLIELFREYLGTAGYRRNQMKYFCWAMLIAYIGGVPNFFPAFNIEIPILMPFGTYAIPIYAFFTADAIIRHRLMDIQIVIRKTAVYSALTGLLTAILVSIVLLGEMLFSGLIGYRSIWSAIFAVFVIALVFQPLRDRIQRTIDRLFFKGRYNYTKALKQISDDLSHAMTLDEINEKLDRGLKKHMEVSKAEVRVVER